MTGLAYHFQVINPLTTQMPSFVQDRLNWLLLTRTKIFSSNSELQEPTTRKYFYLRHSVSKRKNLPQAYQGEEEKSKDEEKEEQKPHLLLPAPP